MEKERISKLMAHRGLCSRREAEEYIANGRVQVNDILITKQGIKVPINSKIVLNEQGLHKINIILNKPLGYVSNLPQKNYKDAKDLIIPENRIDKGSFIDPKSLHVVGRLDINSKGLLLFSSDGRVAKKVIGPKSNIEKEYVVHFYNSLNKKAIDKLRFGLKLDGKSLKRAEVKVVNEKTLTIVLKEGKNRQIRRMCDLVGLKISSLKRVRIDNIQLGSLPVGKWMEVPFKI